MLKDNYTRITGQESGWHTLQYVSPSLAGNVFFCIFGCLVLNSALMLSTKTMNKWWFGFIDPLLKLQKQKELVTSFRIQRLRSRNHNFRLGPLPPACYREAVDHNGDELSLSSEAHPGSNSCFYHLIAQGCLSSLNLSEMLKGLK